MGEGQSWHDLIVETWTYGHWRLGFVTGLAALIFLLNFWGSPNMSPAEQILASAIIVLSALPSWLWLTGRDRALPFMPFLGMVFTVYYAAPLFLLRDYTTSWSPAALPHRYVTFSLEVSLLGLICIYIGYYGPLAPLLSSVIPRPVMAWRRTANIKFTAWLFCLGGLIWFIIQRALASPLSFAQLMSFASDLCLLGACILFALQLTRGIGMAGSLLLWAVLIPIRLLLGFATGLTSQGLIIVLLLMFTYASLRHRLPWTIIICGAVAFCILRPAEQSFRALTWRGGMMENASIAGKSSLFASMVSGTLSESMAADDGAADDMMQFSMRRLGTDSLTLAGVLHDSPDIVPYWNGASYYPLLFKPLPRALFPDKPEEVTGQTFGHRYGLLNQANFETSYNLPQLIEGYVNFGIPGVVIVMVLFGILYRLTQLTFIHANMGFGALISGIYLSVKLLQIESAASLVLGDLIWTLVFLAMVNLAIQFADRGFAEINLKQAIAR